MTKCNKEKVRLPACKGRRVEAEFVENSISSDGGVLLLREIDRKLNLTQSLSNLIPDSRKQHMITHSLITLLQQRIYGIALGYEDLNDHDVLRTDPALQTAVNKLSALASSPTLCRFENRATQQMIFDSNALMVEQFIKTYTTPPEEIILDFDATDDRVHGNQEKGYYHGHYRHYCFLPLHVFCQSHLLVSYLRPSSEDGAKHAWAILSLLVKRIRQAWPSVKIIFRGDGGFCRHKILSWCDKKQITYYVGLAKNNALRLLSADICEQAESGYEQSKEKQRLFSEFQYGAKTWKNERRIIVKAEHTEKGANPRYVVTNDKDSSPAILYDSCYCARGEMENRIKEIKNGLFSDRTSCHGWWANQLRLIFSSMAYILMDSLRRTILKGTELAHAQCETIRLRLCKIGAMILRNTRRIRFLLSGHYPRQALFLEVSKRLYLE